MPTLGGTAERGNVNMCFSTPYSSVIQLGVLSMSGGKTSVILNGGFITYTKGLLL